MVCLRETMSWKRFLVVAALFATLFAVSMASVSSSDSSDAAGTVTFDPNGGTADPYVYAPFVASSAYLPGNDFVVDSTSYSYSKSGYTFVGWDTSATATSPKYSPGNVIQVPSDMTLYAVWEPKMYNVTFVYGTSQTTVSFPYGSTFDTSLTLGQLCRLQNNRVDNPTHPYDGCGRYRYAYCPAGQQRRVYSTCRCADIPSEVHLDFSCRHNPLPDIQQNLQRHQQ